MAKTIIVRRFIESNKVFRILIQIQDKDVRSPGDIFYDRLKRQFLINIES